MATIEVTEFTDPGCVWSWSSEPKLRRLRRQYGDRVAWRRVFGIQIDDVKLSFPDRDPVDGAEEWRADWLAVAAHSGAPITPRLEWMHASTWPASRAAKAAEAQGDEVAEAVLRRLREAVFVDGRPADNPERIAARPRRRPRARPRLAARGPRLRRRRRGDRQGLRRDPRPPSRRHRAEGGRPPPRRRQGRRPDPPLLLPHPDHHRPRGRAGDAGLALDSSSTRRPSRPSPRSSAARPSPPSPPPRPSPATAP